MDAFAGASCGGCRLPLHRTPVSAAIPGARTPEQLAQNVAASNRTGLSPEDLKRIASIQREWNQ